MDEREIERRFTYVAPDAARGLAHRQVNDTSLTLAHAWNRMLPEGREKSLALTALQEARMWANAAIATSESREGG